MTNCSYLQAPARTTWEWRQRCALRSRRKRWSRPPGPSWTAPAPAWRRRRSPTDGICLRFAARSRYPDTRCICAPLAEPRRRCCDLWDWNWRATNKPVKDVKFDYAEITEKLVEKQKWETQSKDANALPGGNRNILHQRKLFCKTEIKLPQKKF